MQRRSALTDEAVTQNDAELDVAARRALDPIRKSPALRLKAPAPLPAYPPAGNVQSASFGVALRALAIRD